MSNDSDKIVSSPFQDVFVPSIDMWTLFSERFDKDTDKMSVIDGKSRFSLTYTNLCQEAEKIATNLILYGFRKEVPVLVYMSNCIEYIIVCLAVWRIGGTVVCVNPLSVAGELAQRLKLIPCDIIICQESNASFAVTATKNTYKKIFSRQAYPGVLTLGELRKKRSFAQKKLPVCKINPSEDIALINFSSGTTGFPKAVAITHEALVGQVKLWGAPESENLATSCIILQMPFSHIFGISVLMIHIAMGVKVVVMEKFDLEEYLQLVSVYKADHLFVVPPIAVMMCKSDLINKYDLSCVQKVSSGGATLGKDVHNDLSGLLGRHVHIRQIYGLTEAAGGCMGTTLGHSSITFPPGTVGVPLPNVSAKVVDIKSGENLGPGQTGEICIKSRYFMKCYLNDPVSTAQTIDRHGWIHTGDIGFYNHEGCFFIVDRLKDIIKYKGYQIAPAELESLLLTHPDITEAGVTGISDPIAGELPHAWVVRRQGSTVTESILHEFIKDKVAPYKRIRGGITFVEAVPKAPSGKILRREIKRLYNINGTKINSKL